jgi:hypothetical protein
MAAQAWLRIAPPHRTAGRRHGACLRGRLSPTKEDLLKTRALAAGLAAALSLPAAAPQSIAAASPHHVRDAHSPARSHAHRIQHLRRRVQRTRALAVHMAYRAALAPPGDRHRRPERHVRSSARLRRMVHAWRRRYHGYHHAYRRRLPVIAGLMCVHRYEGSMTAVNAAGPYYGGWQMNASFERRYGRRMLRRYGGRHADAWRPRDQLRVAFRGHSVEGWWPWPRSAAICGLL